MGRPIDEYYVECTRTNKEKKEKKLSRYARIQNIYDEAIKATENDLSELNKDFKDLKESLDKMTQNQLQSDKYYLYFTQLGKDMYTGKKIDLSELKDYDIDHIIPQSIIKDDSIENRVLVLKSINNNKSDTYPIPRSFLFKNADSFYKMLYKHGLIGEKKLHNLQRVNELTPEELSGFVNRQLVFTNQAVKGLISTIKYFKENDQFTPKIIYSKSENVSDFRHKFDLVKSRTANNFHHAHDAYLNIIVGRALDKYFSPWKQNAYTIQKMHENGLSTNPLNAFINNKTKTKKPIMDGKNIVWNYEKSVEKIKKVLYTQFDIMVTTRSYVKNNMLEKVTIKPKGEGNVPVKTKNSPLINTEKYGGFKAYAFSNYCLIETKGKKIIKGIPTVFKNNQTKYLDEEYGINKYKIILPILKINTVIKSGKKKFCITGKTGNRYVIKNLNERIFSEAQLKFIHKLDKFMDITKSKNITITGKETVEEMSKYFVCSNNKLIISVAANENAKEISLTEEDIVEFYNDYIAIMEKEIYNYSNIVKIANSLKEKSNNFINLSIFGKCKILSELLTLLKCNERETIDLSLINLSKASGNLSISSTISNCEIIAESITGFYSKVLAKID